MTEEGEGAPPSESFIHPENETPLASKTFSSSSTSTLSLGQNDFAQTSSSTPFALKCPCGNTEDDGFAVQCERCSVWHHSRCVGFVQTSPSEVYHCRDCKELEQEDTIDVVMNEPSFSAQEIAFPTTTATSRSPKRKRSVPRKAPSTLSRPSSPAAITMTAISENIVDNKVLYLIDALKQELLRKPFAAKTADVAAPYRQKNFEFSDAIRMENIQDLETALKPVEVKEVGHGRDARFAVYATEPIDPGLLITEFTGQIRLVDSLLPESKKGAWIPQTFVLFPNAPRSDAWWETDEDLTLLAIDARKFGSLSRYVRRSCRPNMSVKVVCVGVGESATLHFVLASSNVIAAGEELCLPLDFGDPYNDGLFFYDCACSQSDLCLSPYAKHYTVPPPKKIQTSFRTDTESTRSIANSSTSDLAATRKLSREERKMQRYIEFFDKMDRIEHKKEIRRSGENSVDSKSRRDSTLVKASTSTDSSSPPPPPKRRSLGAAKRGESSPITKSTPPSPPKEPMNPKKAWLKAALQSLSQPSTPIIQDNDDLIDVVGESSIPLVVPKARKGVQKPKLESPPPAMIKSPEEPGEIVLSPPPVVTTRPAAAAAAAYEDIPAQQSPPQVSQRRGFEPPHPEDRYARINRPKLLIDDRHSHAFTSPDRRTSNFMVEDARSRWDEQGFVEQQRSDRRSFEQHRKFHDELPSHFPRATSTTGTSSSISSPSPREYVPRDAYSHQQREHRFHPHDRISQQQHQHRQDRPAYSHPQHQDSQRRRMFSRDEEMGRGREYDELPPQQRTRLEDHFRGQSPPLASRRPFDASVERRSPQHHLPRTFFPPEDSQRLERSNRFMNEGPSRIRHQEDFPSSESPHTHNPYPRPGGGTRDLDRHTNNDTQQQQ